LQSVNRLLFIKKAEDGKHDIRVMHPYFVSLFLFYQGFYMLALLASYVFLSVVAWQLIKAHEVPGECDQRCCEQFKN
jgi:hypothetical protein